MGRIGRWIALPTLMFALAIGAAGCGDDGGGELALDDYFERLEEIDREFTERSDEAASELDAETDGEENLDDVRDEYRDAFDEFREIGEGFVDEVRDLDPPETAQAAHDAAVSAYETLLAELRVVIDEFENAATFDDLRGRLSGYEAAAGRVRETCAELEQLAVDEGIEIDLQCE